MKKFLIIALGLLTLTACSSVPLVKKDSKEHQIISSFESSETLGVVYLYRDRNSDFNAHEISVNIEGDDVFTYPSYYRRIELKPGEYHFEANGIGTFAFEEELDFKSVAGEVSFFEYKPIHNLVTPNETRIIPKTRDEAVKTIVSQGLKANPIVKLPSRS